MPCFAPIFECAGDQEIDESIFVEEEEEDVKWSDPKPTPPAALSSLRRLLRLTVPICLLPLLGGPFKQPPQPAPTAPEEAAATVEGEAMSSREAPPRVLRDSICEMVL